MEARPAARSSRPSRNTRPKGADDLFAREAGADVAVVIRREGFANLLALSIDWTADRRSSRRIVARLRLANLTDDIAGRAAVTRIAGPAPIAAAGRALEAEGVAVGARLFGGVAAGILPN
jgi:hypothetical protein